MFSHVCVGVSDPDGNKFCVCCHAAEPAADTVPTGQ